MSDLNVVHAGNKNADELAIWLQVWLVENVSLAPERINRQTNFTEFGVDSVNSILLTDDLERFLGIELEPTLLWEYSNIDALIQYLGDVEPLKKHVGVIYQRDRNRGDESAPALYPDALRETLNLLETDNRYGLEYNTYAVNMYFGKARSPTFQEALIALRTLLSHIKH